jgi:hypothetical protein
VKQEGGLGSEGIVNRSGLPCSFVRFVNSNPAPNFLPARKLLVAIIVLAPSWYNQAFV